MGSLTLQAGGLYLPIGTDAVVGKFAATDGNGDGTLDDPYSLTTAFTDGAVLPGETLWLRGGTYYWETRSPGEKGYVVSLRGTSGAPITIRPYPGERAIIDGGLKGKSNEAPYPEYLRIRDLEVLVSENVNDPTRLSEYEGSEPPADLVRPWGGMEFARGHDIKLINNIIHDNMQGIGFWQQVSGDSELYGNIIYNNGWDAPDRKHGHAIYTQNGVTHTDWKYIRNNISTNPWVNHIHAFGTAAPIDRFYIANNMCAAGLDTDPDWGSGRVVIGSDTVLSYLLRVIGNICAGLANRTLCDLSVGYGTGNRGDDVVVTGNRIWGSFGVLEFTNLTSSDNFAWQHDWTQGPRLDGVLIDIPSSPYTFLQPNIYDSSRAHLMVQNFADDETVAVDVSGFLGVGDNWELMDPRDLYGDPMQSGTCSGSTITIALDGEWLIGVLMNRG